MHPTHGDVSYSESSGLIPTHSNPFPVASPVAGAMIPTPLLRAFASRPVRRYGHTMMLRPAESSLYMFGGLDGRGQFLNDFWRFKLDPGQYECDWQELFPAQTLAQQYSSRDTNPNTPKRRGDVPGQPSGRAGQGWRSACHTSHVTRHTSHVTRHTSHLRTGHTATLANVTMEDGQIREVMTILGGYGPNCSDYCRCTA